MEWEREGEEAPHAACVVTLVVTPVTPALRLFFVRRNALNVGISSKTICCYACYAYFLLITHGKYFFPRVFLYIKVFDFWRNRRNRVTVSLRYEAKLRYVCAFFRRNKA